MTGPANPPIVGILADVQTFRDLPRHVITAHYTRCVTAAGAIPIVLPPAEAAIETHLDLIDALVLTGGDDPRTEPFGEPTHPGVTPVDPERQNYETRLLQHLERTNPDMPVLGVCLGMQMMALVAGGRLNQHLPTTHDTHADHWNSDHTIQPEKGAPVMPGVVHSNHKQAIEDPGSMQVLARAHDGVIEAVGDTSRAYYVGVQWHPERTKSDDLGQKFFRDLVGAIRR